MSRPSTRPIPAWVLEDIARQERIAWKPTPAAFDAFKARDLVLAAHNIRVLGQDAHPEATLHNLHTYARAAKP